MSISTRLIIFLVLLVGISNLGGGYIRLHQRGQILENATKSGSRAHGDTLKFALEGYFRNGGGTEIQKLIDNVAEDPRVGAVVIYRSTGEPLYYSRPLNKLEIKAPADLAKAIASNKPVYSTDDLYGENEIALLLPMVLSNGETGAIRVSQPTAFMQTDLGAGRDQIWQLTLIHWSIISIAVWLLMRYYIAKPIRDLIKGAAALSHGDLSYRVNIPRGGHEFSRLADSFNRMADRLIAQREASTHAAEEQRRLEQQLLIAERLAALGRLAAGVAHEMGAPLNVIKGRIEMLRAGGDLQQDKVDRNLEIIDRQADTITHTVQQLLNLARPRLLSKRSVSWNYLVDATLELVESDAAAAGVTLIRKPGPVLKLEVDPEWLGQVLTNLYRNAIHAMPNGGCLAVELIPNPVVKNGLTFAAITVSDTGTGIAAEHLNRVFDPFFTTKDVGQGTGLGLSLSRRIVEEHGGWVAVENLPGGGAAFTIFVPVSPSMSAGATEPLVREEVA